MTLSFDHDIIDGAPAAHFTQQLKDLIDRCESNNLKLNQG